MLLSSSSSASSSSLLLLSLAGAAAALGCWMALTPTGKAFALRVWEGDVEGARRRKAIKQLRFLEGRLEELVTDVEVSSSVCGWGWGSLGCCSGHALNGHPRLRMYV